MGDVTIKLGAVGGRSCQVIDNETGRPVPNVRKITIVCEVGKPTIATIEVLAARVEARATATIETPAAAAPPESGSPTGGGS